ncbi:MAG: hypothetical protein APR54_05260 [Candidatus Cloacimonas sp. SDB]|nr:MAG: hypothetical protein APR54_05260 [Candidatus Cloacimonas sp. SDB]
MKDEIRVPVRDLVEFVLKSGDLEVGNFSGQDRARAGQRIHKKIQNSRKGDYQKELPVSRLIEADSFNLNIGGRIDGVFLNEEPVIIEEIKTVSSNLSKYLQNENPLHWGQAKLYAFIYAESEGLDEICVQLTYFELKTARTVEVKKNLSCKELEEFFFLTINKYISWLKKIIAWQNLRDDSLQALPFPHSEYRKGQKELAVAAYKIIRQSGQLLIQAPTGIGKTAATIYPALKAMGQRYTEKIFFLTARTTGKQAAVKTMQLLQKSGAAVKFLVLTAKEKICFTPGTECSAAECKFARGYYDRIEQARSEIFNFSSFTRKQLEIVARQHQVCPFEFSLDLALWSDCIIGDYNYAFDPRTKLKRFFGEDKASVNSDYTFLIDEAHNLVDRSREMFSAELRKQDFLQTRRLFKQELPELHKAMGKINNWFLKSRKLYLSEQENESSTELPKSLLPLLNNFLNLSEGWLSQNIRTNYRNALLEIYFLTHRFRKIVELFDENYTVYYVKENLNIMVKLFCLNPAKQLENALKSAGSALIFSATLTPLKYFKEILGCDEKAETATYPSPFPRENLQVFLENKISIKYKNRKLTLEQLTDLISSFIRSKKGNYLIFFPSYEYMNQALELVIGENPEIDFLVQTSGMSESEREDYIAAFSHDNLRTTAGFAVMGGVFGEGIDLIGKRLDGAIIIGVGLPGISFERELIRDYFNRKGKGFDYAYKFPGITRVLQAAGRVIRTETDRGKILLIDERFSNYAYRSLLPQDWQIRSIGEKVRF